ncbi:hypothetical protein AT984_12795 [Paucibacter sp. KCTC 42545]|nr:hypothetical protein AT984_12795 [Paucibacter sp. KCTC 42545]
MFSQLTIAEVHADKSGLVMLVIELVHVVHEPAIPVVAVNVEPSAPREEVRNDFAVSGTEQGGRVIHQDVALAKEVEAPRLNFFQIHASVFVLCCVPTPDDFGSDDLGLPGIAAACRSMNFFVTYRSLEPGGDVKTHNMDTADLAALEV